MYNIEEINNSNPKLNQVIIKNKKLDFYCVIYPNLGASLQKLTTNGIEIIDGIPATEEGLITYSTKFNSSFLFPFPSRIPNGEYSFNNIDYKLDCNETNSNNSLHGHIHNKSFSIKEKSVSKDIATITFSYLNNRVTKGFPFSYKLEIKFTFSNAKLAIDFDIYNTDTSSFPFGIGWHPYFNSKEGLLFFDSDRKYKLDENLIPQHEMSLQFKMPVLIKDKFLDDCFILKSPKASFKTNDYTIRLDFSSKSPNSFLQVYTPPGRNSIAIEPMTCAPNSFNNHNGLLVLKPKSNYKWNINLNF